MADPNSGLVLFGPGSTTTILPEENSETIPSDAASLQNFQAPHIDVATTNFDMQAGALILAPGAAMNVSTYVMPGATGLLPFGRVLLEAMCDGIPDAQARLEEFDTRAAERGLFAD